MRKRTICVVMLFAVSSASLAEGGSCPAGYYPIGGQGAAGCAPISNYEGSSDNGAESRPQLSWVTTWGAVAIDGSRRAMGASNGAKSKYEAEATASADCRSRGGGAICGKRVLAYENQCVAVVTGDNTNNAIAAESIEIASDLALKSCTEEHDTNCHVYYSACTKPVLTR